MKDHEYVSFVIVIQIQRYRTREILGLSQKTYINKVLDRCGIKNCSRVDKLSLLQYPKNDLQKEKMKDISYASVVGGLVCSNLYPSRHSIYP